MNQESNKSKAFHIREVLLAFTDLPRVLRLVWDASPVLVIGMAFVMFLQGIIPLATVLVARLLIDRALQGIAQRTLLPIILPVVLQLAINLLAHFCTRLQAALRVLLNFRLSDHLELLILRKASMLDLASFEDAEFYDRLNHLCQDALNKPLLMIIQLFGLGSSLVTMLSLLGLLFQLSWWLVLVALIVPIPAFIADSHYAQKLLEGTLGLSTQTPATVYTTALNNRLLQ
jgi:ATP-binding cassette subfamily B protein